MEKETHSPVPRRTKISEHDVIVTTSGKKCTVVHCYRDTPNFLVEYPDNQVRLIGLSNISKIIPQKKKL
jgi:hypothetical protein